MLAVSALTHLSKYVDIVDGGWDVSLLFQLS